MIKRLIYLITLIVGLTSTVSAAYAQSGDWKLYPAFDNYFDQVIDTPNKIYILALGQKYTGTGNYKEYLGTVFVYDKQTQEMLSYNKRNYLSGTIVRKFAYNADKDYLMVIFSDGNIDMIHSDGKVRNIPGLSTAIMTESKLVNDITFDASTNSAYLATDFGFVVVDDKKHEIRTSRNYHTPIKSVARIGESLIMADGSTGYVSSASAQNLNLDDFQILGASLKDAQSLLPLSGNKFAFVVGSTLRLGELQDNTVSVTTILTGDTFPSATRNRQGWFISGGYNMHQLSMDGTITSYSPPGGANYRAIGSFDNTEFWFVAERQGLTGVKLSDGQWVTTHEPFMPNAPLVGIAGNMAYNSRYGMLVNTPGMDRLFSDFTPAELGAVNLPCGYKNNTWTIYSPAYLNKDYQNISIPPRGLAIDPDNPDYIYMTGGYSSGVMRLNLADPKDIVVMGRSNEDASKLPGFHCIMPFESWGTFVSAPAFDKQGNLWMAHCNRFDGDNPMGTVWVWPAAERRANNFEGWVNFTYDENAEPNAPIIRPLTAQGNERYVVYALDRANSLLLIDTNGTPTDRSDDRTALISNVYDQDGSVVTKQWIRSIYEDQQSGLVWIGCDNGIFTFRPKDMFEDATKVRRIKVARNDGTNLADYLLDGIEVLMISADGQNRKWIATLGGGLVQTTPDGSRILNQFTAENSYLPNNNVYTVCFNPANNSVMAGTQHGLAEYFMPGVSSGNNFDLVKVYPNPVRPDYLGWINIEGLVDNSLVKIVDAEGNLIKELGHSAGGKVEWDGTNLNNVKVPSGVYFVFMSTATDGQSEANVAKILVVK